VSEDTTDKKTFCGAVSNFFKSIGLKVKIILGAIVGIFGFVSIFLLRKKMNARQILELELKKVREEIEIEKTQEEIDRNDGKILLLEGRIEEIKTEIKELEEFEARDSVSNEELDEFFDDRGF
jgi:cell division protein FtsL